MSIVLGLALLTTSPVLAQDRALADDTDPSELRGAVPLGGLEIELPDDTNYIWGGVSAPEFDTVVGLGATDGQGNFALPFCSGTVVHPRWVLTAAHCVVPYDDEYAGYDPVVYFDDDLTDGYLDDYRLVADYEPHPGYCDGCSEISDDIGLLRLDSNAPVATNGVLLDSPSTYAGDYLTFVGFGVTSSDQTGAGERRKTEMLFEGCITPDGSYYEGYLYACSDEDFGSNGMPSDYDPQFLFSTDDDSNVCSGDSGGAVFREHNGEYLLVGVNSYTAGACEEGMTGSTRVDWYESWVESTMGAQLQSTTTPPDPDTDTDPDTDPDTDSDTSGDDPFPDTGLGEPERPPEGAYKGGIIPACSSLPLGAGLAWPLLMLASLLPLARRRR